MNILILGSQGQIGLHLSDYLKKNKKYKIFGLDLIHGPSEDLRVIKNKKLKSLIKKSDFVFFLAFDVGGSVYLKTYQNSYAFLNNNLSIMSNVFQELKNNKKPFIFTTSQMSNMVHSPYGVLKKIGENITNSLNGISVRFWNVYGIENDPTKTHVITDFILKGIKSKRIRMKTHGKEERDFLFAEDCCEALELIMNNYKIFKKKLIIDLHSSKFVSIIKISKIISKLFKEIGKKVIFIPSKDRDQVQMQIKNYGDKFLFNFWKPKYSLKSGIRKIFNHYLELKK
jgi:nucleoside-diphosphate-sugar epimerase